MVLLFDIGNTHTHLGLADGSRVRKQSDILTADWFNVRIRHRLKAFVDGHRLEGAALCSVVPRATPLARQAAQSLVGAGRSKGRSPVTARLECLELTPKTVWGVGIDYPNPKTIGPDRLANAVAARHAYGAPVVVVDFGTAVTFDVVDKRGNYVGGIIAPGLAAMTDYLHEKTALLPRIRIREVKAVIGKNTEEAMLVGAVHGYRGLVHELIRELRQALNCRRLPVVATGGYGELIARKVPEITAVDPLLTLEGLRLVWEHRLT
jgi:type III pantothenate kinase